MVKTLVAFALLLSLTISLTAQQPQPSITFRVDVDNLRLRAAPDKNAKVVAELPEHTQLKYLNETAGAWDEIKLRGRDHKARWYKVEGVDSPVEGWVYGGAVVISSVYIDIPQQIPELQFDFLDLHQITADEYDAIAKKYHNPVVYDTLQYRVNDTTLLLKFENGTEKTIISTTGEEDNVAIYTYLGKIPAAHLLMVEGVYYEDMDITLYDMRNGKELVSLDFPDLPRLSFDEKWLAMSWTNPYESESGIQIYKNTKEGLFESALITVVNTECTDLCWDNNGGIFFRYRQFSDDETKRHFYRLKMPQR